MTAAKHKVFISFHHGNDQAYKDHLLQLNVAYGIFIDASVDTGGIDDNLSDESIRQKIRDEYLRDSSVTILLVGSETQNRKHVDWEIYSSMFDGAVNKKSGVLVINLPEIGCQFINAPHGDAEKNAVYPGETYWTTLTNRAEYEERYPFMPARIIDNLISGSAKVSVTNWSRISCEVEKLRFLIDAAFTDRATCQYDLSRPMRRSNS